MGPKNQSRARTPHPTCAGERKSVINCPEARGDTGWGTDLRGREEAALGLSEMVVCL